MRKTLMLLIAALCLPAAFSSCGKESKDEVPSKAVHSIEITVSEDLLNAADLVLTYTDADNSVVKSMKIEEASFSNSVTYTSFPVKAGFQLTLTEKQGASAEKYNLSISGESSVSAVQNNETEVVSGSLDDLKISFSGVDASRLSDTLQKIQKLLNAFSSTFTITVKNGSVVYTNS